MSFFLNNLYKKKCKLCSKESFEISEKLGVCLDCIINNYNDAIQIINKTRYECRAKFSLTIKPPRTKDGLLCGDCVNDCILGDNEIGFCNLVINKNGKLIRLSGDEKNGLFSFYYDPIPTNCVSGICCPGCAAIGYPKYSYSRGPEIGFNNLSVFYQSCTFDCLFCQNYHYRTGIHISTPSSPNALINAIKKNTSCICFFGGDPAAQIRHSNEVGKLALEKSKIENKIIRICWETNGSAKPTLMSTSTNIALISGGNIKIDIKTFDDTLNIALCGSSNRYSYANLKEISKKITQRSDVPLLVVSTLLVPGYVDANQVTKISNFLASLNPQIPYSLLAFYPAFIIDDLPTTSKEQAMECLKAAKTQGLENVFIGNKHLLR